MATFYIKQGASFPSIPFAITQNGLPVDLTGDTVTFRMRLENGTSLIVNGATTIDSPATQGTGFYSWLPGDTATAGRYYAEWVRSHLGLTEILPVRGYDRVVIVPMLS